MDGASTIVIIRPDLSIAGSGNVPKQDRVRTADLELAFFSLVRLRQPDVIVMDCRESGGPAIEAIRKIKARSDIPVLVVCEAADPRQPSFRIGGAAECLEAPFDVVTFNGVVQAIIRAVGAAHGRGAGPERSLDVAGMRFDPQSSEVEGAGVRVRLTTAESRLLLYLARRPWKVCSRAEISDILYGASRPTSDRAIDVVVTRLRRKLVEAGGPAAQTLIKTEFRLGYTLAGDVSAPLAPPPALSSAVDAVA